jgi:hypothetical protein
VIVSDQRPTWVLGIHELKPDHERYYTSDFSFHPSYDYPFGDYPIYDLAMVTTDRPIEFNKRIGPICLPTLDFNFVGKKVVAAAW